MKMNRSFYAANAAVDSSPPSLVRRSLKSLGFLILARSHVVHRNLPVRDSGDNAQDLANNAFSRDIAQGFQYLQPIVC
jgi:hypothetical protein